MPSVFPSAPSGNAAYMGQVGGLVAPVLTDPGAEGWPAPPKVQPAEVAMFGELAEVVRLAGLAAVNASDAYALACKTFNELLPLGVTVGDQPEPPEETFYREVVQVTWQGCENARATYREVAEKAIARARTLNGEHRSGMTILHTSPGVTTGP